jgi:hypothetical protein
LDDAFEIIAAIIVEETAIPILPSKKANVKSKKFFIIKDSNRMKKRKVITKFIRKTRSKLKINLPENIVVVDAIR